MTNERMAEIIAEGDNDELLPLLWEKMRRLFGMWADNFYTTHKSSLNVLGLAVMI